MNKQQIFARTDKQLETSATTTSSFRSATARDNSNSNGNGNDNEEETTLQTKLQQKNTKLTSGLVNDSASGCSSTRSGSSSSNSSSSSSSSGGSSSSSSSASSSSRSSREGLTDVGGVVGSSSRLPVATNCKPPFEATKRLFSSSSTAYDINNNSNSNNKQNSVKNSNSCPIVSSNVDNIEKQEQSLVSSLEFVNQVVQDFLLDKICWTCDNCHSVPLILWRSATSITNNNSDVMQQQQQQQLKQRQHLTYNTNANTNTTNNNTHRYSNILDNQATTSISNSFTTNKSHQYSHQCRHRLCSKCLQGNHIITSSKSSLISNQHCTVAGRHHQQSKKCPYDDHPMQSSQIVELHLEGVGDPANPQTVNLAKELVYCLNKSQGCRKSMPLNDLEAHTKDCLYAKAQCPLNCGESLTVKSLAMGHLTTCPRRPINCDYCDEEIALNAMGDHKKICPKRPVSCQFCHSNNLIQEELEEHYEICDKKARPCRFNPVCPFAGTKDECSVHEKDWEFHIDLLLRHIINDNMFASKKNRITDIIAIMKDLDNETTSLKSQLNLVTIKLEEMYKQNEESQELIMELKLENENIKKKLEENKSSPATNLNNNVSSSYHANSYATGSKQLFDEIKLTKEKLAKLEAQQKADANIWRALIEVTRKEIEALKATISSSNPSLAPTNTPMEKTIVASLVSPPMLTPIQPQSQTTKPFPIPSTIFEQQEHDSNSSSPIQQHYHHTVYQESHSTPAYTNKTHHQQQQMAKQQYLNDNLSQSREVYSQAAQNYAQQHHVENNAGRLNNHSDV